MSVLGRRDVSPERVMRRFVFGGSVAGAGPGKRVSKGTEMHRPIASLILLFASSGVFGQTAYNQIDFALGGGRIAFLENGVGFKVLSYTASNWGIIVNNGLPLVLGRNAYDPDFSSDGSRILHHNVD